MLIVEEISLCCQQRKDFISELLQISHYFLTYKENGIDFLFNVDNKDP